MDVRTKVRLQYAALADMAPMTGCGRAPTFNILGSFFPAWLVCLTLGLVLTVGARWLLSRFDIELTFPVLTWPSLTALFTFTLWLALFR